MGLVLGSVAVFVAAVVSVAVPVLVLVSAAFYVMLFANIYLTLNLSQIVTNDFEYW